MVASMEQPIMNESDGNMNGTGCPHTAYKCKDSEEHGTGTCGI